MDIIDKAAPIIDADDVGGSLAALRNYIVETMETIDYTLSGQKQRIVGAVSEENFEQLALLVASLSSNVSNLSSQLSQAVQTIEVQLGELEDDLQGVQSSVTALDERLTALEGRVTALEGGT